MKNAVGQITIVKGAINGVIDLTNEFQGWPVGDSSPTAATTVVNGFLGLTKKYCKVISINNTTIDYTGASSTKTIQLDNFSIVINFTNTQEVSISFTPTVVSTERTGVFNLSIGMYSSNPMNDGTINPIITATKSFGYVIAGARGQAAVVYQLIPSANVIKLTMQNGTTIRTPSSLTYSLNKVQGSTSTSITSLESGFFKLYKDGIEQQYAPSITTVSALNTAIENIFSSTNNEIKVEVYTNGSPALKQDSESVPFISDGQDGTKNYVADSVRLDWTTNIHTELSNNEIFCVLHYNAQVTPSITYSFKTYDGSSVISSNYYDAVGTLMMLNFEPYWRDINVSPTPWSNQHTYDIDDYISYQVGSTTKYYRSLKNNNTGHTPNISASAEYWSEQTEWNNSISYSVGTEVYKLTGNILKFYICQRVTLAGNDPAFEDNIPEHNLVMQTGRTITDAGIQYQILDPVTQVADNTSCNSLNTNVAYYAKIKDNIIVWSMDAAVAANTDCIAQTSDNLSSLTASVGTSINSLTTSVNNNNSAITALNSSTQAIQKHIIITPNVSIATKYNPTNTTTYSTKLSDDGLEVRQGDKVITAIKNGTLAAQAIRLGRVADSGLRLTITVDENNGLTLMPALLMN